MWCPPPPPPPPPVCIYVQVQVKDLMALSFCLVFLGIGNVHVMFQDGKLGQVCNRKKADGKCGRDNKAKPTLEMPKKI